MWISIDEGPDRGKRVEVSGGSFTIGRHPDSTLVLTDSEASSHHAAIEKTADGKFVLRDLNSTNGTFVNGTRIHGAVPITGSERVSIGQDVISLSLRSPDATVVRSGPVVPPRPTPAPPAAAPVLAGVAAASAPAGAAAPPPGTTPPVGPSGRARPNPRVAAPVIVLLVIAGAVIVFLATRSSSKPLTQEQIIADATPSVVRIQGAQGAGSGIVINAKKQYVLTNAHVVVGNSALTGQIGNNTSQTSALQVVAADPCDDLAVLKLATPVPKLKALTLGSSGSVKPGDSVTVLGYPGSLQQSLNSDQTTGQATSVVANTGTVSQVGVKANPDPSLPQYQDTIVHQAPVNHGDSGGPLLNGKGQVVGINTLTNTNNQGQYYAIAIDYAKRIISGLESGQSRDLIGWDLSAVQANDTNLESELLGLYQGQSAYSSNAQQYASVIAGDIQKGNVNGMFDGGDQPGSPADTASTAGYLITKMNGDPVPSMTDVCNIISSVSPGSPLKISGYDIASGNPQNIGNAFNATLTVPSH